MKGPAIFVFLVAVAFLTASALGWAQYRTQPMQPCMGHSQQTTAAHPYAVYQAQAAMQMNAHYAAQHQANQFQANQFQMNQFQTNHFQTNHFQTNQFQTNQFQTNQFQGCQHQTVQHQAWQNQAWNAQAHQATSVAVVPMWNQNHQGAHALVATASATQPPLFQTAHASTTMCSTQKHQHQNALATTATVAPLDQRKLTADGRKYAPPTSVNLNATNLAAKQPISNPAASVNVNAANIGAYRPAPLTTPMSANSAATNLAGPYAAPGNAAYALPSHHDCADIRSASNLFNISLQTSQTVNVNVNVNMYNAGPQFAAASKYGYTAVQPGSAFARTSQQCGCEFNKMSMQNQLIGLDRPMNASHANAMRSGYASPNYPMAGSKPAMAYAGNLGAYRPSAGCNANPMYANNAMMTGPYMNPKYANNAMMTGSYTNPMYANNAMMTGSYANPTYANNAMMTGLYANPYANMTMLGGPAAAWYTNMMYADNMMLGYPGFAMQPTMMGADYAWNANMMQSAYMMAALSQMQTATVQNQLLFMDTNFQLAQLQAVPPGALAAPQQMFQGQKVQCQNQQQFVQMQQQNFPCQCQPQANVQQQMPQMQQQVQMHVQTGRHHHMVAQQNLWRPQKW